MDDRPTPEQEGALNNRIRRVLAIRVEDMPKVARDAAAEEVQRTRLLLADGVVDANDVVRQIEFVDDLPEEK